MNTRTKAICSLSGVFLSVVLNTVLALPAQTPLNIGLSTAKPNIMLMVDDSGSMSTNVTTTSSLGAPNTMPAGTTYTCSTAISYPTSAGATTAAGASVITYMKVNSSGSPLFCTNSSCSTTSSFSTSKCFKTSLYYKVSYYGGASLGTYTGLQLDWYFKTGKFTAGSLSATTSTTKTRIQIAQQATADLVSSLLPDTGASPTVRMGLATYNQDTANGGDGSGGGMLKVEVGDLNATQGTKITTALNALTASGNTPLATTLVDIGEYFTNGYTGNLTLHPNTTSPASSSLDTIFGTGASTGNTIYNKTGNATLTVPIQDYCQKSFVILVSDGLPNGDRSVSSVLRDYTGDCATDHLCNSTPNSLNLPGASGVPLNASPGAHSNCKATTDYNGNVTVANDWYFMACQNGTKAGRVYETGGSDYLDDVAQALYEMDLRPNLIKAKAGDKNNLTIFTIGLADPSLQTTGILNDTAAVGGGSFYFAGDSQALADSFNNVMASIASKVSSSSSVAANSTNLNTGTYIYQALFDTSDWTGSFQALPISATDGSVGSAVWNAATLLIPTPASATASATAAAARNIMTYNPTTATGATFSCANLSSYQKTALGISSCSGSTDQGVWRLNWLRGDVTHEQTNPLRPATNSDTLRSTSNTVAIYRNRTHLDRNTGAVVAPDPWVLGDIINSNAVYVSNESYNFDKLPNTVTEGGTYKAFVTSNATRRPMVYVGANDGMLHGFDATVSTTSSGKEILAYVPNEAYDGFMNLSSPSYSHQYFVDGSPTVKDAYYNSAWHTVLLGSTGAGGQAIFVLDITNPDSFTGSSVLWEVSNTVSPLSSDLTTDTTALRGFANNMGYTLPQASIGKMHDGSWAAIVANGYSSTNNLAVLYIINIQTGHIIAAIDTKAGSTAAPNGLSTPFAADTDGDQVVDAIYAGDLLGNMWKFDVSSSVASNWKIAYGTASAPAPLVAACTNTSSCSTTTQPITSKPQVGLPGKTQNSGVMVYFGTGKYFEDTDVTTMQTQSLYGIWDNGATVSRSQLQQQSIVLNLALDSTQSSANVRVTTNNTVDYSTKKGWYMDLLEPSATTSIGERIISMPLLRNGRIIFASLTPVPASGTAMCSAGSDGTSWLMEFSAVTGSRLADTAGGTPFDLTGDNKITAADLVTVPTSSGSAPSGTPAAGSTVSASGQQSTVGTFQTPTVVSKGTMEYKYASGSKSGAIQKIGEQGAGGSTSPGSRQSWHQLQ